MASRSDKHPKALRHETPAEDAAARRIVAAARRHFLIHGFRNVTMDDLADELGMSKKTLYLAFDSKTDLVRAVLLDKYRDIEFDLERIMSQASSDVLAALHQLLACMQRHTQEIQPPFVRDIRREAPDMFEFVQRLRRDLIQRHFGKLFEEGRKAGIIRKDISTRLMIEILLGATESIVNPSKLAELGLTVKAGYSTVVNVILEGVLTQRMRIDKPPSRK
ncbi:MAG: TetR/AcrR family transcriptional regulator [Candidatus Binatia bacterium]